MPIVSIFPTGSGGSGGSGIPLAPVTGLATLAASGKAYLKWTDPIDTVVGDATLAAWAGTLLVRKAGSMPTNRRDGTVVIDNKTRDAYKTQYFCDSGLSDGVTYYYKFFPYSTTNTYADDPANEVTITPNPVTTGNVSALAVAAQLNGRVQLTWTDPAATKVQDGVTLSTWASTKVVYKTGSYPTSPDDGTLVVNSTTRNAHASSPLEVTGLTNGTTYYFALFPISTEGAVNTSTTGRITAIPNKTKLSAVPAQSGTLTYTGAELTPTFSNYNTTQLTIGGVVKQTNAGTYKATFTPTADYCWSDGSTGAKEVSWTIGKAAGSLSLNKTSVTLNTDKLSDTVTVTRAGDGVISATSSDTSVATVSINGNVITVNHVNKKSGTATITVAVAAGTNYNAPANKTFTVNAQFLPVSGNELNTYTWAQIKQVSDAGLASTYWNVGDAKQIKVNGTVKSTAINMDVWAFILGFNHNSAKEGTNRIHFQIGKVSKTGNQICFVDAQYANWNGTFTMNGSTSGNSTNAGGWNGCTMRTAVLNQNPTSPAANSFMAALPSDLRAVMKSVTKYSDNTGGSSNAAGAITATTDYLFLLSEFEVQGARTYASQYEQNSQLQYDYYKAGNTKVFNKHNATTTTALWWLRSVGAGHTTSFCRVYTDGSPNVNYSGHSRGVAPAFCV
ncbi:DUF6273 domain-containing protein [Acutalibacter muris]|uniref:DUF6273 domain-containing protein n=1 Tax=Acutalibacter muris TaxID=1796620 RepID=UPI001C3F0EC0|nr:DUF6273 domain-containing protein [Acutalibacter muris]